VINENIKKIISLVLALSLLPIITTPAIAAIDLMADLNRIISGVSQFDANSANAPSDSTIADVKRTFSNNASILREISDANAVFKRNLNSSKKLIPSKDTKDSPAFNTLINLAKGYEVWVRYQNINQVIAQKCIKNAGSSLNSYTRCTFSAFSDTVDNEILGRQRLVTAADAFQKWRVKYGYA
jgi:hypothetical protein